MQTVPSGIEASYYPKYLQLFFNGPETKYLFVEANFSQKENTQTQDDITSATATRRTAEYEDNLPLMPGICVGSRDEIYTKCANTKLLDCQECGVARGAVFLFLVVSVGLAVLAGNCLTMVVGIRRCRRNKASKMDICRSSLAIADLLIGLQFLVVVTYNFSWSMMLTPKELERQQRVLRGSWQAFAAGTSYVLGFISSQYHLTLMAIERLYALARPFSYRHQSKKSVYVGLGIVWVTSASAVMLFQLPEQVTFSYSTAVFLFYPSTCETPVNDSHPEGGIVFVFFYVIPFLLNSCLIIVTALVVRRYQKLKKHKLRKTNGGNLDSNQNANALATVTVMLTGFILSLMPTFLMDSFLYSGVIFYSESTQAYMACFYISLSNSLVNVIIYNIRDKEFRGEILKILQVHLVKSATSKLTNLAKSNKMKEIKSRV
ncbi:unnamed protein product [Clavelina lepadiformis]|uniref:G-protein coupled receptors family 1 profile domain-containing protein n=1 Tax=Clavelina lepadiformis TaxID=159417 RepID=A0ABP0GR12_CLALP